MKRWLAVLLCVILLAGCSAFRTVPEEEMDRPVRFYYCYADADADSAATYGTDGGALDWELQDLGPEPLTALEILQRYLQGPRDNRLRRAFPAKQTVVGASVSDGILTVELGPEFNTLAGIDRSMAAACLVQTMTQFPNIDAVLISCKGMELWDTPLTAGEFILADDAATSDVRTVKLYFANSEGRYLVEETRSQTFLSDSEIPAYLLRQLLEGPQSGQGEALFSTQIKVLSVETSGGVCTVDFSDRFLKDAPQTYALARLAVFSVVNTLTELPEITSVRLLCGGKGIAEYGGLNLSEPLLRDERMFGTGKEQENTADVTLFLPYGSRGMLAPVPVVINRTAGRTLTADVLRALIACESGNGYENPIPDGTVVMATQMMDGTCAVRFNSAFALCGADPEKAKQAVRSVVATLCALDAIEQVSITVHNGELDGVDLSQPMRPDTDWILP